LISLSVPGCIEGEVRAFVRYNRPDDSFLLMEIYTNLHAKGKPDPDHMAALGNAGGRSSSTR
jgi:hypothetical protein